MVRVPILTLVALLLPTQQPPTTAPQSAPAAGANRADTTEETPPQLDSVFRELIQNAERSRPIQPIAPQKQDDPATQVPAATGLLVEGRVIYDRSGIYHRVDERGEFELGQPMDDTPATRFELLPNSWLEAMERDAESGITGFTITAEVTRYRGKNYLFLLKYRRQIEHGNLRP